MLVIHNGFKITNAYMWKWLHSSDFFHELYQVFDTHFCTIFTNAKYYNSIFKLLRINLVRVRKFYVLNKLHHSIFKIVQKSVSNA